MLVGEGTRRPETYSSSKNDLLLSDTAVTVLEEVRSSCGAACDPNRELQARRQSASACSSVRSSSSNIHAARGTNGRACDGGTGSGLGEFVGCADALLGVGGERSTLVTMKPDA